VSAHDASINGGSMDARSPYEPRDATCYRAVANLGRPTRSATCNLVLPNSYNVHVHVHGTLAQGPIPAKPTRFQPRLQLDSATC